MIIDFGETFKSYKIGAHHTTRQIVLNRQLALHNREPFSISKYRPAHISQMKIHPLIPSAILENERVVYVADNHPNLVERGQWGGFENMYE